MMKTLLWLLLLALTSVARADLVGRDADAIRLMLSGDGKIALTLGGERTRVWDVERRQVLVELQPRAGVVLAVSGDGTRVLCCESGEERDREGARFALWRREDGVGRREYGLWRRGTPVRGPKNQALLDAKFVGDELLILWELSIERRGASGLVRRVTRLEGLSPFPFTYAEPGAISPDGTRAIATGYTDNADETFAIIFDVATGRALRKSLRSFGVSGMNYRSRWEFSPRNEVVGTLWGEPVTPWNPADGDQPVQWTRALWATRKSNVSDRDYKFGIKPLDEDYDLTLTFWPNDDGALLAQKSSKDGSKLELLDVFAGKYVPLPFEQKWQRQLRAWCFSRDGKMLVALDKKGDIWAEQVKPN